MNPLTAENADKIYSILVDICKAPEQERANFVYRQSKEHISEWRFCGDLGFGGKFWRNNGRHYVSCYSENLTPRLQKVIDKANELLAPTFTK